MGSGVSTLVPCFKPAKRTSNDHHRHDRNPPPELSFSPIEQPLDGILGNSFCYFRSSNRFLSPTPSDRFVSPSGSFRISPSHEASRIRPASSLEQQTGGFKAISGASVSANTSTPRTVLNLDNIYDEAADSTFGGCPGYGIKSSIVNSNGFEGTSSFSSLPLQPVPRGTAGVDPSGSLERSGFFMSGPIERGAMSGPLDSAGPGPTDPDSSGVPFSAPLGGVYKKKRRKKRNKSLTWYPNFGERKQRPWVVPVLNFVSGRKDHVPGPLDDAAERARRESDLQWALGKAGEDRVHVVVSEEQGWLFVGIYDGFNGPDAPEFLMGNLYRAVYSELQGLFWELDEKDKGSGEEANEHNQMITTTTTKEMGNSNIDRSIAELEQEEKTESKADETASTSYPSIENVETEGNGFICEDDPSVTGEEKEKRVAFQSEITESRVRKRLWELLAEAEAEDGLDLSGSKRFAFSVDDAVSVSVSQSEYVGSKRWLSFSKLKQGLSKHKEGISERRLFPKRFGLEEKETEEEGNVVERVVRSEKRRKVGEIDHESVLRAMSKALETTELAFLDMTDKVLESNPELALMGSCLLVVLMRDEDVYVMNVGDSRAIVGQYQVEEVGSSVDRWGRERNPELSKEGVDVESCVMGDKEAVIVDEAPSQAIRLTAQQLSTDHSTSIEDEITRIKNEHPDDSQCIVNDRVKGRLKVTRAFGAGFLKQPKLNDALLEMFRNEYIGTAPYISCTPSLHHHRLCQKDQFLVLSSDGLYQYLSNQEVVSLVENFFEKFPDGDPAQHLIEELLVRAAKKAGMDFHELLDIPQGDRRKYHDDVTVMVVSLEGRIWKSSGKYP